MEWIKTVLNAVRVAVDGVSARVDRLKSRVKSVEDWVKSLDWVPVVKPVDETLLPETTLDYDGDDGATFTAPMPTVGLTYTVTIGEKTYEAEAWRYSAKDLSAICIGNFAITYPYTDPFIFLWLLGDVAGRTGFLTEEGVTDGKVTVSISRKSENENELPDVFLWSLKKIISKDESTIADTSNQVTEIKENVEDLEKKVSSNTSALNFKADYSNPKFTGSISQNRKQSSKIGANSCAFGLFTTASGPQSISEGTGTIATGDQQHVQGRYNIEDTENKYLHIVGNGVDHGTAPLYGRSNAYTLDKKGVPWFQGRPQFGGTAQDDGSQSVVANGDTKITLKSSVTGSTKTFDLSVDDNGVLPESFYAPAVPIPVTQAKYDAMLEAGKIDENRFYFIVEKEGDSI